MATVEAIALEAAEAAAAEGRNQLSAAVTALTEAGYLHDVEEGTDELLSVLDVLTEVELLGPLETSTTDSAAVVGER